MYTHKQIFAAAALAAGTTLAISPAHALTITFSQYDGANYINAQVPGDGSGLTSALIDASNQMNPSSGFFVETFDPGTYTEIERTDGTGPAGLNGPDSESFGDLGQIADGCSINAFGGPLITTTGGGFGVQSGSNAAGAAPFGNTTCYAFGPKPNGFAVQNAPGEATVKIDYSVLPIIAAGASINYLGLYYGSIDTYNNIAFYSGGSLLQVAGTLLADGVLTGSEILAESGGSSGNQVQPNSNVYVNFFFDAGETFTAFEFRTTGVAFEFDNLVVGLTSRQVPAPATLALIGLGLAGLSLARRRRVA